MSLAPPWLYQLSICRPCFSIMVCSSSWSPWRPCRGAAW